LVKIIKPWYNILKNKYPEIQKNCKEMDNELKNGKQNSTIIWAGTTIETIINTIIQYEKIETPKGKTSDLKDKIQELYQKQKITKIHYNNLNHIRILRNEIAHNNYQATKNEAQTTHHQVYNFTKWFYTQYTENPQEMLNYDQLLEQENTTINKFYTKTNEQPIIYCPQCGSKNNPQTNYCIICGKQLNTYNGENESITKQLNNLKKYTLKSPKKKWTIKRQENKMNYHQRQEKLQTQKNHINQEKKILINQINQKQNEKINTYLNKKNTIIKNVKNKYTQELEQMEYDYKNVSYKINELENIQKNNHHDEKIIEDLEYYKNEKRLITNRQKKIQNKYDKELNNTLEELDYEYETIQQENYQIKKENFKKIQKQLEQLKKEEIELEKEHTEKVLNHLNLIQCINCGYKNPNDSKYCQKCGTLINPQAYTNIKYCDNCGYQIKPEEEYCTNCGEKII
jgi:uncharacterized OB-fold protein